VRLGWEEVLGFACAEVHETPAVGKEGKSLVHNAGGEAESLAVIHTRGVPTSGSFSPTMHIATPVTLPTISACAGKSNRRTSWWE